MAKILIKSYILQQKCSISGLYCFYQVFNNKVNTNCRLHWDSNVHRQSRVQAH